MEVHPKYPYIWYKLGLAYDSIGYKQKAKEYFHRMKRTKGEKMEDRYLNKMQIMNIMDDNKQVISLLQII